MGFSWIAVDMGAGSIRLMLGSIEDGSIGLREIHRFENEILEFQGQDRWDMEHIWKEIRAGIKKAVDVAPQVPVSIGVESWGVDFVLLDENTELVEVPVAYRDQRTQGMQERWKTLMPDTETFERTGINFYIFNTLFQLLSLKGSELLDKTSRILFIPCYINFLLSGEAYNELTISSTSQMLGVNESQWDPLILEKLDLNEDLLGKVISPGTRLGPVIIPEAGEAGMENIAVCGHDTACVVAAIPAEDRNFAFISAGTWCIIGIESDQPLIGPEAFELGLTNERGYNDTYRSLKNIVGLWLMQGLKKNLPGDTSFAEMEKLTQYGEPVNQVIDPDAPVFFNPGDMKEAFDDYFRKTGQPLPEDFSGYLICAYDSLCFSFRYHIEELEKLSGRTIEVLHVVGGGSQSDYLNQHIADTCEREVISGPVEGAAIGNILVQALAMGKLDSLEEGRSMVKQCFPIKSFRPQPGSEYDKARYEKFIELKQKTNN
jgi:sugar (pentulose or hexulose) kinase